MSTRRPVSMWAPRRQDGAASVEFFVTFAVAIILIMAVLQMGLFMVAKDTVNLATFAAARAGAASGGDVSQMKQAFAKALSGLYVAKGLRLTGSNGLTDVSAGNFEQVITGSTAYGYAAASMPLNGIRILNPTKKAFIDFGVPSPDPKIKGRIIPASGLLTDTAVGAASQQTRADALLLKILVRHCYEIVFPMIGEIISPFLIQSSPGDMACFAKHPWPDGHSGYGVMIESQAVVRMTAAAIESNFK